ncbi:hypothetical protein E4U55_002518 [Claviceps digitariae]|nr:hypothetical protein E4U55_002518 [Claviceps digitariae]
MLTTERIKCVGVPWRKWDPANDVCPGVYEFQSRRPPLERLCPACEEEGAGQEGHVNEEERQHGEEEYWSRRRRRQDGCAGGRAGAYAEGAGAQHDDDMYAPRRPDSHQSTRTENVPALSRTSQSTWASSSAMSLRSRRSSADLGVYSARHDEEPRVRVVCSSRGASQEDLMGGCDADDGDGTHMYGPARSHRPGSSSSSPAALVDDRHHRFAKLWGWKHAKTSSQHRRHKSEPKDMRPEKKTRSRWKAIVSRNKSVDSDKSFVCMTAREMQNQGQSEGDPAFGGG